jgi:hypothetical protein
MATKNTPNARPSVGMTREWLDTPTPEKYECSVHRCPNRASRVEISRFRDPSTRSGNGIAFYGVCEAHVDGPNATPEAIRAEGERQSRGRA